MEGESKGHQLGIRLWKMKANLQYLYAVAVLDFGGVCGKVREEESIGEQGREIARKLDSLLVVCLRKPALIAHTSPLFKQSSRSDVQKWSSWSACSDRELEARLLVCKLRRLSMK